MTGPRAFVLDEDPDLADLVTGDDREQARQASVAAQVKLPVGQWAPRANGRAGTGYGLLVLDGLLLRRAGFEGRFGAELLSAGDLLRPWDSDGEDSIGMEATWRVLAPTRLAVLDEGWSGRMGRYPAIGPALAGRALARSRRLVAMMAIAQQPRLDDRLWAVFWELADRHGRVRAEDVHVGLPLTHEVLSHLAAARRPSVSGALGRLAASGRIRREGRGWTLNGTPPSLD